MTPETTAEQIIAATRMVLEHRDECHAHDHPHKALVHAIARLISRAERAEREAKEMAAALQRIINRVNRGGYEGEQIVAEATTALTRNSEWGGA